MDIVAHAINFTSFYYRVLNIVFFLEDFKYSGLLPYSVFLGVSVCTHQAGRTSALQQNWQSSEKSQSFKEKTIFNEHPVASLIVLPCGLNVIYRVT